MSFDPPSTQPEKHGWFQRFRHRNNTVDVGSSNGADERSPRGFWPSRKQWNLLPTVLTGWERAVLTSALLLVLASCVTLGVRFINRHMVAYPRSGGSYTEALVGQPQFINPVLAHTSDVDLDLTQLIYRGLFRIDKQGQIVGDLATHSEMSPDGKTYIITLSQNATWQDGEPITSSDVLFTFNLIQDPSTQSPYLKTFKGMQIDVVDEHTVKMTLATAYAPFLSTLTVGILPEHVWSDIPSNRIGLTEYNLQPIGSGPFQFQSLITDRRGTVKSYHVVRFQKYEGQKPYLHDITFRFYADSATALDALKRHKAQGISATSSDMAPVLAKEPVTVHALRLPQYTAVFYNMKNTILKDVAVRSALGQAVEKNAMIKNALGGAAEAITTPILPGFLGHNTEVKGPVFDLEAAKKTLDDAGWKLPDGNQVRKKGDQELHITLTTVDRPDYLKVAETLKQFWKSIGVAVDINAIASSDILRKAVQPRSYDALLFGEIIGNDPDPYPFWHSSQGIDPGLNLSVYVNKKVDGLLEDARQTSDSEKRRLDYLEFQNILATDQPALFLYNPVYSYALPKKMGGFTLERITIPSDRFDGVVEWYLKTHSQWQWSRAG